MNPTPYQHQLTEREKAELRLNNPTNEVFFFVHNTKPLGYVLMSHQITPEQFNSERGLFPETVQTTEEKFDELLKKHPQMQVVFVGDKEIIDEHFSEFDS